jgi:hypothetical protein
MNRKLFATLGALTLTATLTQASLHLAWTDVGFTARADGSQLVVAGPGGAALAQLIFTPDSVRGRAQPDGLALGDYIVAEQALNEASDGSTLGYPFFGFTVSSASYTLPVGTSGYMYIRILDQGNLPGAFIPLSFYLDSALATIGAGASFDIDTAHPGAPTLDDVLEIPYGGSHPLDLDGDFNPDVDSWRISDGSIAQNPGGQIQENWTVAPVPEPGTLAFLGVGALLGLIRRRRS